MDALPTWLQWLVSLATILSSIGVIVAFVQLKISSNQFNRQLKITEDQFKLLNQGFVKMTINVFWVQNSDTVILDPTQPIPLNLDTLYYGGRLKILLENVGNLPVKTRFKRFKASVDDCEMYSAQDDLLVRFNDTIHPKTNGEYYMPDFPFKEPLTGLHLAEIAPLKITFSLLIEYQDFNDNKSVKTIEREMQMVSGIVYNVHIYDKL